MRGVRLVFKEAERERTQEFSLRWSAAAEGATKEILRQRWNFSPTGSTTEIENYQVDLTAVSVLELVIQPDVANSDAFSRACPLVCPLIIYRYVLPTSEGIDEVSAIHVERRSKANSPEFFAQSLRLLSQQF